MDFTKAQEARAAAQELIEFQLRDQSTGEPLTHDGKPCIILLKSPVSDDVFAQERAERSAAIDQMMKRLNNTDEVKAADPTFDWDAIEQATNKRAVSFVAGFKNIPVEAASGKIRKMNLKDAPGFVALNRISEDHHWRNVLPLHQNDGETDEEFSARKAEIEDQWLQPSFAQQIIDEVNRRVEAMGKPVAD